MRKLYFLFTLLLTGLLVSSVAKAQCPTGPIVLTTQSEIDNYSTNHPGCTTPDGLQISGSGITNLNGLAGLTAINGDLQIDGTAIPNLNPLNTLTGISGKLILSHNHQLTTTGLFNIDTLGGIVLLDLPALVNVAGITNNIIYTSRVDLDSVPLTNMNDFSHLVQINGDLEISHSAITTMSAFSNLNYIGGWIYLEDDPNMTTIGITTITRCGLFIFLQLPSLTSIAGLTNSFTQTGMGTIAMSNTGLTDLTGLEHVTSVPNMYIDNNPNLVSLHGLEGLSGNLYYGISIHDNAMLTDISALSNVDNISDGTLEIVNNPMLNNLVGLGNIHAIGNGLWIRDMSSLISLGDLNSGLIIHNNNSDGVNIRNNAVLALCSFGPLCDYINAGGDYVIQDNAPGCNSGTEVLAGCVSCTPVTKTWTGDIDNQWNNPDNWLPLGVPTNCTEVVIDNTVSNYPSLTNDVSIHGLTIDGGYIDMNGYTLTSVGTLNLQNAGLQNGGTAIFKEAYNPRIQYTYVSTVLKLLDFGGQLDFNDNNLEQDVEISDSTGRQAGAAVNASTFFANLAITNNSDYGNFYISNSSPNANHVLGSLTVTNNSSSHINIGLGDPIYVQGDLTLNTDYNSIDIVNIVFDGYIDSYVSQSIYETINAENVSFDKPFNSSVFLNQPMRISSSADFKHGIVHSDVNKEMILDEFANVYGGSAESYVDGPLRKIGSQPFLFPVGDEGFYAPLNMTGLALPDDAFTVQYLKRNPQLDGYDTSLHVPGINKISTKEYWNIQRDGGFGVPNISLSFDRARSGSLAQLLDLKIARWDGTQWQNEGNGGTSGDTTQAMVITANPVYSYGPMTLAYPVTYKPAITVSTLTSTNLCRGSNLTVPFTLDSAMVTGNVFWAQLSDASGSFASPTLLGSLTATHSGSINAFIPSNTATGTGYKIRVTGTMPLDTSVNTIDVTINALPQLTFNTTGNTEVCLGTETYASGNPEAGVTYTWTVTGGGIINSNGSASTTITWNTPGGYTVNAQASTVCGNGPYGSIFVLVRALAPSATPVITSSGRWLYSSFAPVTTPATTYQWYKNNLAIPGANSSSYYAAAAGNYMVVYKNFCGEGPASNTISFGAASQPQNISFPAIPAQSFGNAPFVPNAIASSGLPVFFTILSGPALINPQNNLLTITGVGLVTIRATQPGNNVYDTAAPLTQSFMVNPGTQVINFATIGDQSYGNPPVSLSASVNSGLPITYTIVSGPAIISGNTVTITGVGTITVQASQSGNTNYDAAAPVTQSFCVAVPAQSDITGYTNLCPGTATYSVNNIPGATYSWSIMGSGALPSATNTQNINWTTPGVYAVLVSASASCGVPGYYDTLIVNVINSIQPDSVQAMFPANGATNQQLPLTLSWIPARPNSFYTFDLYLWRADAAQPATPYAANLSSLNYILPLNSGLSHDHPYKWMIVSHNGSCTAINTGPVQEFTLTALPDLYVSAVQAPATAFSGQTITIDWTVINAGPNRTTTNQNWSDAVFLSFDTVPKFDIPPATNGGAWSILDFPVKPLLIGTRPNVSALDSGQQYSNSINYTLPANYSLPLYAYVITNYPRSGSSPLQGNYANDTARAPQPIAVTLSPTPDLRVDTVFTPATTFSGSAINLTYKVKNYGVLTPAGASWTDKVYISQSPLFDINTAIPVKFARTNGSYYPNASDASFGNSTQMQANDEYTKTAEIIVPNYIFGNYFIYVMTNATASLYEAALVNNNLNRSEIQVFLTPTPHLTVNSLTVPLTTVSTTQPVSASWNINNTGFTNNIEKNKGHYIVANGSCPTGIRVKDSLGFGGSYWLDRVYLSTDPVSLNTSTAILLNESEQGVLNSGLLVDDTLSLGCQPANTNLVSLNINTTNVISQGSNHPKTGNFTIPDNLMPGTYYIYVLTNATRTVFEYPGTSETRRSAVITIQRPDATVSATAPASVNSGQSFAIQYSVLNQGPGTVFNHRRRDRIYVSSAAVFNASAQLIDTKEYVEDLPVGTAVQHSLNYTFPSGTSGTRYFFVVTNYDSLFRETNQVNNTSTPVTVAVGTGTPVDLVVSAIQLADTVYTITPTLIKYTVPNNAAGTTTGTWTDSIFISCSATYNPATAYFIASRTHSESIGTGASYRDSFNITLPFAYTINSCFPEATSSTAYFFVKTNADNAVFEGTNTSNNVLGTGSRTLINPLVDQIVTTVSGADNGIAGRPYLTGWTVKNLGYNPGYPNYSSWNDIVYFSPDSVFNSNAAIAGTFVQGRNLNTNQTYTESRNATVPNLETGDYYVLVKTNANNSIPAEKELSNNLNLLRDASGAGKKVHITRPALPDLADSIVSAPVLTAAGQPLTIIHRSTNKGSGETYPGNWSDDIWLSSDFVPGNGGDIRLSATNHSGVLQTGQSYNDTITATLPLNIIPGNYVLISRTNSTGNVFETNMDNNLAFSYITIFSPAPSDLIVENIAHPDTVYLGYTIDTAKWTVRNLATNAATGISSDGIYLSKNNILDSTAILLGIKNKTINIGPLAAENISLAPLVDNVTEGNYNMIVKTDLLNNIAESNKDNNTALATTQVYVKVKELPMNVLEPNTLQAVNRFYKLIIPDSLDGATIRVTLKSADSLTMKNQLFIAKGYVPTAAQFDYSYDTPNYGNQNIVMTSVTAGVYYIRVRCISPNPALQSITLKAVKLPFAILNVQSSSGGNAGNVTVKISGSLFINGMTAKLSNAGTTIHASALYFVNSTTVYATFNLRARPLGSYDVTLTKPDATAAVLPNGFNVVAPNNGGLITGGGVNTGAGNENEPGCDPGAESGQNSQLVVEMVAPTAVFAGWPFTIQVNYTNPTNADIPAQVRVIYSERDIKMALSPDGVDAGTTTLYLTLTEPGGPPGIIRAGASGTVTIYSKAPLSVPAHTHVEFKLQ